MKPRLKKAEQLDKAALVRATKRVEHWMNILHAGLNDYETENPEWRLQTLLCVLDGCFVGLRECIESPKVKNITWESPVAELHYPVNWNWDRREGSTSPDPQITYGSLTSDETKRTSSAIKAVARIMTETLTQVVLKDVTREVMLEKRGESYTPMFTAETTALLRKIRSKPARQRAVAALFEPFCMGMEEVEINEAGQVVPGHNENFHPAIQLAAKFNEQELLVNLLFIARPLVVDVKKRQAYYPLSIGLSLHPAVSVAGTDWMRERWVNPGKWPKADQKAFWAGIHGALKKMREDLRPKKTDELQKAVLSVNLKLEVPVDQNDPVAANQVIDKMLSQFREAGKISEVSAVWSSPGLNSTGSKKLLSLVDTVESASTPAEKGKSLEALVEALLESVPGFEVQLNGRTDTEEIDVVVVNSNDDTRWRHSPLILFECKNWATASGKNELVQFKAKVENRRGQCRVGFLVSWNGFSATVRDELLRCSTKELVIAVLSGDDLRSAARSGTFLPTLQSAWSRAVLH